MNKILFVSLLLIHLSAQAQHPEVIGYYVMMKETVNDTETHIFISRDSIKQVRSIITKRGRDMWLEIKSGLWATKDWDTTNNDYSITLKYNDGAVWEMIFNPLYETFPIPKGLQPNSYQVRIGEATFTKAQGKNGFMDRIKNNRGPKL